MQAEEAANQGRLEVWHFRLDTIWRELIARVLRRENPEAIMKQHEELRKKVDMRKGKAYNYEMINDRHQFLKIIQDKVGMGAKYRDAEDDDFE